MINGKKIIITLLFVCLVIVLGADSTIVDFIDANGFEFYWDDILQRGIISRGTEMISFIPGFSLASVNFQQFIPIDPLYVENGTIYVPELTEDAISNVLLPLTTDQFRTITTIFVDPGHGGKDPGTIGKIDSNTQLQEKDIVLQVALGLVKRLRARFPNKRIVLSRENDIYRTLEERTEMANSLIGSNEEKVVFISIHANAALDSMAKGIEVWYLPPEYRRQVLLQPSVFDVTDNSVIPILNTILEEEYTVESIILARNIERAMMKELDSYTFSRGLKEMDWYVVKKAFMPSVLVEIGFVTNKEEIKLLNSPWYLQKLSEGIYNGILNFIKDFENVSQ